MFDVKDISKEILTYCISALSSHRDIQTSFQQWWHISPEVRLEIVMPCVIEFAITGKHPVQLEVLSAIVLTTFSFHLIDDHDDSENTWLQQALSCQQVAQSMLSSTPDEAIRHILITEYNLACEEVVDGMAQFNAHVHGIDTLDRYEELIKNSTGKAYAAIGRLMCCAYGIDPQSTYGIEHYCTHMGLIMQAFNDYNDTFLKGQGNDLMTGRINIPILLLNAATEDVEIREAITHRQMMPLFYKIKAAMAHYNIRNQVIEKAFYYRCRAIEWLSDRGTGLKVGLLIDFMDATFTTYLILNRSEPEHKILNYEKDKKYMSTALYLKRSLN